MPPSASAATNKSIVGLPEFGLPTSPQLKVTVLLVGRAAIRLVVTPASHSRVKSCKSRVQGMTR